MTETQKAEERKLSPPSIDRLEKWMNEGGCETACVHESFVEPDGHCPECGAGSWLLVMGLI